MQRKFSAPLAPGKALTLPPPPLVPLHRRAHDDYRRLHLPYRFQMIDESARLYLPVNRYYKPLGLHDGWVDYRAFPANFVRFICDPHAIKNVWFGCRGRGDDLGLYLYWDDPKSLEDYGERYAKLLEYVVPEIIPPHTLYAATATVPS
jgi:hypothetical protein